MKATVGDIDIALSVTDRERVILNFELMDLFGELKGNTMRGSRNGDYKGVQVNLFDVKPEEYGAAVLMATGSGEFNVMMRGKAKKLGLRLNQYGLWLGDRRVCDCSTEDMIFAALGMTYVRPEDRL